MVSSRVGFAAYLLTPLPLALSLALSTGVEDQILLESWLLVGVIIAFSLVLASTIRAIGLEFEPAGSNFWGIVALASCVGGFLLGSYAGSLSLQWVSAVLSYDAALLYLGGHRVASLVAPASLALLPPAFNLTLAETAAAGALLALASVGAVLVLVRSRRAEGAGACSHCYSYSARGEAFCSHCGKNFAAPRLKVPLKTLAKFGVFSLLIISVSLIPAQVISSNGGVVYLETYRISGLQSTTPLGHVQGWNASAPRTVQVKGSISAVEYNLSEGGEGATVVVGISAPARPGTSGILTLFPNVSENGTVTLGSSGNVTELVSGKPHTSEAGSRKGASANESVVGYLGSSILAQVNGSTISSVNVSWMVVSNQTSNLGVPLSQIASQLASQVGSAGRLAPLVTSSAIFISDSPVSLSALGVLMLWVPFQATRRADLKMGRKLVAVESLSEDEFEFLGKVANKPGGVTGEEAVQLLQKNGSNVTWESAETLLERLTSVGLVKKSVGKRKGNPLLLWRSEVEA